MQYVYLCLLLLECIPYALLTAIIMLIVYVITCNIPLEFVVDFQLVY
jgi:ABC-type multidrug transport system permease subunit